MKKLCNKFGEIRGWIDGKKVLNSKGAYAGSYEESVDKTYDKFGTIVGDGDQRAFLLDD